MSSNERSRISKSQKIKTEKRDYWKSQSAATARILAMQEEYKASLPSGRIYEMTIGGQKRPPAWRTCSIKNGASTLNHSVKQTDFVDKFSSVGIGDLVKLHLFCRDGTRERIEYFEGYVIARKGGGLAETVTVRRLYSGVGVERVFPVYSPNIREVEIVRKAKPRCLKYSYLCNRNIEKKRMVE